MLDPPPSTPSRPPDPTLALPAASRLLPTAPSCRPHPAADSTRAADRTQLPTASSCRPHPAADSSRAAPLGLQVGIFVTAGQICSATSRLIVHKSIAQRLTDKLVAAAASVRTGDPLLENTQMGALVSESQRTLGGPSRV